MCCCRLTASLLFGRALKLEITTEGGVQCDPRIGCNTTQAGCAGSMCNHSLEGAAVCLAKQMSQEAHGCPGQHFFSSNLDELDAVSNKTTCRMYGHIRIRQIP